MNLKNSCCASSLGVLACISLPAIAQDEFLVRALKVDRVREPKSPSETIQDCLKDAMCEKVVSAAAIAMGVPPKAVDFASGVGKAISLGNKQDDELKFDWNAPDGYQLCRLSVDVVSTVPAGRKNGALIDISFEQRKNHIVTWVPGKQFGGGKTWVEANLVATYVSDASADKRRNDSTCKPLNVGNAGNPAPWVYRCRGKEGDNQGRTACASLRY